MTIFDDYKDSRAMCTLSPSLLWDYDLSCFDYLIFFIIRNYFM